MSILALNVYVTGLVGDNVSPRRCTMVTSDSLAIITRAGYLNNQNLFGNTIQPNDIFDVIYNYNPPSAQGSFGIFQISYNISQGFSLLEWTNPGNVVSPVIVNDFATFNTTSGQISDFGYKPSDPAQTNVVMFSGSPATINHVAGFADANGTIKDIGGIGTAASKNASDATQSILSSVEGAVTVGQIPSFFDVSGSIQNSGILASNVVSKNSINTMASGSKIILDKNVGTESGNAVTINHEAGAITTVALTTVQYASEVITLNNSLIGVGSLVLVSVNGGTNTTTGVNLMVSSIGSGSCVITLTNLNSSALNGTVVIGFSVF